LKTGLGMRQFYTCSYIWQLERLANGANASTQWSITQSMYQAPKYSVGVILAMIDQLSLVVEVMSKNIPQLLSNTYIMA